MPWRRHVKYNHRLVNISANTLTEDRHIKAVISGYIGRICIQPRAQYTMATLSSFPLILLSSLLYSFSFFSTIIIKSSFCSSLSRCLTLSPQIQHHFFSNLREFSFACCTTSTSPRFKSFCACLCCVCLFVQLQCLWCVIPLDLVQEE